MKEHQVVGLFPPVRTCLTVYCEWVKGSHGITLSWGTKAMSAKISYGGGFDWGNRGAGTISYQADKTPWSGQGLGSLQGPISVAGAHLEELPIHHQLYDQVVTEMHLVFLLVRGAHLQPHLTLGRNSLAVV